MKTIWVNHQRICLAFVCLCAFGRLASLESRLFSQVSVGDNDESLVSPVAFEQPSIAPPAAVPSQPSNQQQAPQNNPRNRRAATNTTGRLAFNPNLASTPNMFGDSTGGSGGEPLVTGALGSTVAHPTFGFSRLNLAENDSPLVRDRVYVNYRHFENASYANFLGNSPTGGQRAFDVDRLTLGAEYVMMDGLSLGFRLPVNYQLSSNLNFDQTQFNAAFPPVTTLPFNSDLQLGNIGMILKYNLSVQESFVFTGGMGLNLPTASAIRVNERINDVAFNVIDPITGQPIRGNGNFPNPVPVQYNLNAVIRNQTVNATPYLAAVFAPNERWFGQGFFQVDVPINPSTVTFNERLATNGALRSNLQVADKLTQQTLLRFNMGVGRWLWRNEDRYIHSCSMVFETHYTSALNKADIVGPFTLAGGGGLGTGNVNVQAGNTGNRVDIVNFVLGIPFFIGQTGFYNGFTVPVGTGYNRNFDFEYTLAVDRRF